MFKTLVQTDEQGIVQNKVLDVEQYNYTTGSFSFPNDPVIIDNDLVDLLYNRQREEEGNIVVDRILIHPYTEQILTGKIYGGFQLNEQVFQTPVTVDVINYLVLNGNTADDYRPVVGTIGVSGEYIGKRAAKFFGTYQDLPEGLGAGLRLPNFSTANADYFLVEGFLYFEQLPTAYSPVIMMRGTDQNGGSTLDSFCIEYDSSNRELEFRYSLQSSNTPGYDSTIKLSPTDGVTTNTWHHFSVIFDKGNQYPSQRVTFFDGLCVTRQFFGATYESVRNSTAPLTIGCGFSGERPLKGWLDSVMLSRGASGDAVALRTFNINKIASSEGTTAPIPPEEPASGDFTVYSLSMNGPVGTSLFPCDMPTRIISSATYVSNEENKIGVGLVSRQQNLLNGITLFAGYSYGHSVTGASAAPCFGANSGSCIFVSGVDQLHGLTTARRIRSNAAEFTISYLLGSTGMYGLSGASGDFPIFFTNNWGGNTFSYLATQTNTTQLNFIYDTITVSGRTGVFYVKDYNSGKVYGLETADVQNLYADVVEYHSLSSKLGVSASSQILGVTGMQELYSAKAFEDEAIVQKVAPSIDRIGILYINNNGRMSKKTSVPERAFVPYNLEGIIK